MHATITVESPIALSPRVAQVCGMFDLAIEQTSRVQWTVSLPLDERPWNIGLIAGPSGCGKSTIARHFWPRHVHRDFSWPRDAALLDGFPAALSIKDVTALLSAVGFSSPPAWLRPFHVLSTGQQFRVTLARLLAEAPELAVMDEYTSVVDRTVAQIGSAALAKVIRGRGQRFIAVTCHDDVEAWLQPDWVYRPAENAFTWRCLRRRPTITLDIVRCRTSTWRLFAAHHYLSHKLNPGAVCFLATWNERPVAFSAWLPFVGAGPPTRREHRTVTLPGLSGRRHRQRSVGRRRLDVEGTGLPRRLDDDAPGDDARPPEVAALAHAPAAVAGDRPRTPLEETPARHDAPDGRLRVRRSRLAASPGSPAAVFVSRPHGPLSLSPDGQPCRSRSSPTSAPAAFLTSRRRRPVCRATCSRAGWSAANARTRRRLTASSRGP